MRDILKGLKTNKLFTHGHLPLSIVIGLLCMKMYHLGLVVLLACLYFFRSPNRLGLVKANRGSLLSPAYGTVTDVYYEGDTVRVSIFLSVTDVHVQYAPFNGVVVAKKYHLGAFYPAFLAEKSQQNERLDTFIRSSDTGQIVLVRQIAGTIARTIVSFVKNGQVLQSGQDIGMIKFGSRVDVVVPSAKYSPLVVKGQYVNGGETLLFNYKN